MRPVPAESYVGPPAPPVRTFRWWIDVVAPLAVGAAIWLLVGDMPIPAVLGWMTLTWLVYWLTMTLLARRARRRAASAVD